MLVDRIHQRPVRKLELRAEDGRLLGDGDTMVKATRPTARRGTPARIAK